MTLIFVDVEADSPCPNLPNKIGMTEFGGVEFESEKSFYGLPKDDWRPWEEVMVEFKNWMNQFPSPFIFVSDNPAFDWQWINYHFHHGLGANPFGHSARRIGDFYAGLTGNFRNGNRWKRLRVTKHDHNPVHDALGNVQAFKRMLEGER